MARSRNIKPSFFTNEELAECSFAARLLFAGLWCLADREGRLQDRPRKIKAELFPYENDASPDKWLSELEEHEFIERYEAEGVECIWITGFHNHQRPHHMEEPSLLPPPPGRANKYNHSPVTKEQRVRIFDRDAHRCVDCQSTRQLQIDHIIPVSKGGTSDDGNLRALCRKCNEKKGNREQVVNDSSSTQERTESQSAPYRGNQESGKGNQESERARGFRPPTVDEVASYCLARNNGIDPEAFVAHYASKGWKVGKNAMKDWQSAVITWEKNKGVFSSSTQKPSRTGPGQTHDPDAAKKDPNHGRM